MLNIFLNWHNRRCALIIPSYYQHNQANILNNRRYRFCTKFVFWLYCCTSIITLHQMINNVEIIWIYDIVCDKQSWSKCFSFGGCLLNVGVHFLAPWNLFWLKTCNWFILIIIKSSSIGKTQMDQRLISIASRSKYCDKIYKMSNLWCKNLDIIYFWMYGI